MQFDCLECFKKGCVIIHVRETSAAQVFRKNLFACWKKGYVWQKPNCCFPIPAPRNRTTEVGALCIHPNSLQPVEDAPRILIYAQTFQRSTFTFCAASCVLYSILDFFFKLCLVLYSVNPFLLYFVAVFVLMGSEAVMWPSVSKWSMRIGGKVQQSHLLQQEWEQSHEYLIDCSDGCAHPHVVFECVLARLGF